LLEAKWAVALGSPARSEDYHPIAAASPLEAFAGVDIDDVETDHVEDWTARLPSKPAVK
jgi:hypothetical protein